MDVLTKEQRRKNMQAIRSTDTKAEITLAKSLWAKGYRYRKNNKSVFGKPDLTFKRLRIAIFVDSEFFHGKNWETQKNRIKTNRDFWWSKIEGNMRRDDLVINKLEGEGWIVLRFWDKEILKNASNCINKIEDAVNYKKSKNLVGRYSSQTQAGR
jgi:DNA mismatch endonuclease, patch repair protein